MIYTYSSNLNQFLHFVDEFYRTIDDFWKKKYGDPGIYHVLKNKLEGIKKHKITGIIIFKDKKPAGIAWIEKFTEYYGNMVLYSLMPEDREYLASALVESGCLENSMLELIKFEDTQVYEETFISKGLIHNYRQRMAWFSPEDFTCPKIPKDISFREIKKKDAHISGEISYKAHKISQDYIGYPDLDSIENRVKLEKMVFNKLYGPIIKPASLFILYKDQIVGACLMIESSCWGYKKVPWIFDIVIEPEFQGKGFGTILLTQCLAILKDMDYPVVGLAVTISNKSAIHIYEKYNFTLVEKFSEFAYKTT
ncbi:GNAT family N-acetyltransferase [Candidatus Margulisiibacteriota bacterium]